MIVGYYCLGVRIINVGKIALIKNLFIMYNIRLSKIKE